MEYIVIDAKSGFKPRSEYKIKISNSGEVKYRGGYYVSTTGDKVFELTNEKVEKVLYLAELLLKRNKRFYLNTVEDERFVIEYRRNRKVSQFSIDSDDPVSADIIDQMNSVTGVSVLIKSTMYLWLIINKTNNRSKELALVCSTKEADAFEIFFKNSNFKSTGNLRNWNILKIGHQFDSAYKSPELYFSYRDNQVLKSMPDLFLNTGPVISNYENLKYYLFTSFGKRFNDPKASYILVLATDILEAKNIFSETFPHLLDTDYQMSDLKSQFSFRGKLFTHHIPIALR